MKYEEAVQFIKEQRAAGMSLGDIARALNDAGAKTKTGTGKWSKSTVSAVTKAEVEVLDPGLRPRDVEGEDRDAAHYAEANVENKDEVIWVADGGYKNFGDDEWTPMTAVPMRRFSTRTHAWDEEAAAFRKLTEDEKLESFSWREPVAWMFYDPHRRAYGVGRDSLGARSVSEFTPVWPSKLVQLLSRSLNENVEELLDRYVGETIGTGRVDKAKITKTVPVAGGGGRTTATGEPSAPLATPQASR